MHFLVLEPMPRLNPDANMVQEQLEVGTSFVDELLELPFLLSFKEGK
jgi:hypothetical protein